MLKNPKNLYVAYDQCADFDVMEAILSISSRYLSPLSLRSVFPQLNRLILIRFVILPN